MRAQAKRTHFSIITIKKATKKEQLEIFGILCPENCHFFGEGDGERQPFEAQDFSPAIYQEAANG